MQVELFVGSSGGIISFPSKKVVAIPYSAELMKAYKSEMKLMPGFGKMRPSFQGAIKNGN